MSERRAAFGWGRLVMGLARRWAWLRARLAHRDGVGPAAPGVGGDDGAAAGSNPRQRLGRWGERVAARFLRREGYKVLYRNFRPHQGGEIDLVCRERATATLVFVEVKTRSTDAFGRPALAVGRDKRQLIERGANAWLRLLGRPDVRYRFDIVEIVAEGPRPRCNVIRDAFARRDEGGVAG